MAVAISSLRGGQPTGTTEFITSFFMRTTASANRLTSAWCPASTAPFASMKGNAAYVGFSEP